MNDIYYETFSDHFPLALWPFRGPG